MSARPAPSPDPAQITVPVPRSPEPAPTALRTDIAAAGLAAIVQLLIA
ncbi:hypothetical protein ACWIG3_24815 [Streptomyces celluloflavus]